MTTLPSSTEHLEAAALIALSERNWPQASQRLKTLLELWPDNAQHWYNLGYCYCCQGLNRLAAPAFEQAFKRDQRDASLEMWAQSCLLAGEYRQATDLYLQLWPCRPDAAGRGLVQALRHLEWAHCPAEALALLPSLLAMPGLDVNALSPLIAQCLLRSPFKPGSLRWQQLPLVLQALQSMLLVSVELESYLTESRRSLLMQVLEQGLLTDEQEVFWAAMVHQCWLNEYLYSVGPHEQQLVQALQQEIDTALVQPDLVPETLAGSLCLLAAYQNLGLGALGVWLQAQPQAVWPPMLQQFIERRLVPFWRQQALAAAMPCLTPIAEPTSCRVQAQYEAQPYPRWFELGAAAPLWLGQRLQQALPGYQPPGWSFEPDMRVLIAGCGTGRHALRVATEYRQSQVLALDLSRTSLGYAQDRAQALNIESVRFMQADILDLARLPEQFPLIESIGVLHHMAEPEQGLAQLKRRLLPQGLMQLGLYSRLARTSIAQCRDWIGQLGLTESAADIRRLRQVLMDPRCQVFAEMIRNSRDFYSLSGCRDLLFHQCEHQFDIAQIQALLATFDLRFLGFSGLPAAVIARYQACYPEDPARSSLVNWAEFEQRHPWVFSRMYIFWCQSLN